jgi:pyroglutamyl-peptidase
VKVLVSGFEPFGGDPINSSLEVVRNLPRAVGGSRLSVAELPVVYGAASTMLRRLVALERPDCVIALGLAGGPHAVSAVPGAPAALPPTLPLREMIGRLRAAGIPVETSRGAGTFLCNHVFFHLVEHAWRDEPSLLAGFVHLPFIEPHRCAHPGAPYLELDLLVRGIVEAIRALDG